MKLLKLEIKNLHGYLTRDIDFQNDINLLVGINGSGKTSILNLINWLLTPSLPELCVNYFKKAKLKIEYKGSIIDLNVMHKDSQLIYDLLSEDANYKFSPLKIDLRFNALSIESNLERYEIKEQMKLSPENEEEKKTIRFLESTLPKPIVIGLDRNLYMQEGVERSYVDRYPTNTNSYYNFYSPLEQVKSLATDEYLNAKNRVDKFDEYLKNEMMISSFEEPLTEDTLTADKEIELTDLNEFKEKVSGYLDSSLTSEESNIDSNVIKKYREKIEKWFNVLAGQLENSEKKMAKNEEVVNSFLLIANYHQLNKIKHLVNVFDDVEQKKKEARKKINNYLDTINFFLRDSRKEIYFEESSRELYFRVIYSGSDTTEKKLTKHNIEDLSSGEKQIIILFTFIYFNNDNSKVFIIDEPELSLHPKWQESFLNKIKEIMPNETQLLFATHSPLIVHKHDEYVKLVSSK